MNIYLSKVFTRLARRDGLTDVHICQAIVEMNEGLIDADLGAGLFKKGSPCLNRESVGDGGACSDFRQAIRLFSQKQAGQH